MSQDDLTLVKLKRVNKIYSRDTISLHVLKDIELTIYQKDFIAIMGPSGSGKSTLLNIIGLLDRPTSGIYYHLEQDTTTMDDDKLSRLRNKSIGFVFQTFNLFPQLNVFENIEVPMLYAGIKKTKRIKKITELAELLGLRERLNHRPTELSGGEMQRVAIARALANEPSLILADEPTGNLDELTGRNILSIFDELNRKGTAIIVVTHNPDIASFAKLTLSLRDGRFV
jgi:putative ABC transport system ATP-binding protein